MSRLATRIGELDKLTQGRAQAAITDADATKDMPGAPLSIEDYVLKRVNDQSSWYRRRAKENQDAIGRGRALALAFGGFVPPEAPPEPPAPPRSRIPAKAEAPAAVLTALAVALAPAPTPALWPPSVALPPLPPSAWAKA